MDEKLRRYAAQLATSMPRTAPIQLLIRGVAPLDSEIDAVWRQMQAERLTGMTAFATHLHDSGSLRRGCTVDEARDVLWTYNSVELYDLLVLEQRLERRPLPRLRRRRARGPRLLPSPRADAGTAGATRAPTPPSASPRHGASRRAPTPGTRSR